MTASTGCPQKKAVTVSPENMELLKDAIDEAMKEFMSTDDAE